jgi:hypothetical protein
LDEDEDDDVPYTATKATSITLNESTLTLDSDATAQLTATVGPAEAAAAGVIWSSSKPAVAAVDNNGLVKALSNGSAVIWAKAVAGGKTTHCDVTVKGGFAAGLYQNGDLIENLDAGDNLLARSFAWIKANSAEEDGYVIVLDEDINVSAGFTIGSGAGASSSTGNGNDNKNLKITLEGLDQARTITKTGTGALFTVYGGTGDLPELILGENITLQGHSSNTTALVVVGNTANTKMGELIMKDGSRITGNTGAVANAGAGVLVSPGGTFTMNGGSIDGNNNTRTSGTAPGAVFIANNAEFKMTGGVIAKNSTAMTSSTGAVGLGSSAPFEKTGGTIYGAEAAAGENANNCVNAVFILGGTNKKRSTTADESVNLTTADSVNWK